MKNFCDGANANCGGKTKLCWSKRLLLHKKRERGGKAVQKTFFTDGPNFPVAEKAGQGERAELLLDQGRIVVSHAEEILTASIAAAKAAAINRDIAQILFSAHEQFAHIFGRRRGITPLKLHGLAGAGKRADGEDARIWIAADELAHQEITAMKILEVFVDD